MFEEENFISFDDRIKNLSDEIDSIINLNIYKKKAKLDELENLINQAKLNLNRKNSLEFFNRVKELISIKEVTT